MIGAAAGARAPGVRAEFAESISILDACQDEALFAHWFRDPTTWHGWRVFLCALFALPMDQDDLELYQRCTGRTDVPVEPATEAWLVCGRRAASMRTGST